VTGKNEWVLLAYRMPRDPSSPRIAVWRRLRKVGAVQIVDGLVALPADARTKEHLEWVASDAVEAGGEATVWIARLTSARQERELAGRMAADVADAYQAVIDEAADLRRAGEPVLARTVARLRRELRRIGQRDYFPPAERDRAHTAVEALAEQVVSV
jgi:microcompartment protein CcmK/EutM